MNGVSIVIAGALVALAIFAKPDPDHWTYNQGVLMNATTSKMFFCNSQRIEGPSEQGSAGIETYIEANCLEIRTYY